MNDWWEPYRERAAVRPHPTSVAHLCARGWPGIRTTFDDALKSLGIDDAGQRAWVVDRLDVDLEQVLKWQGYHVNFWFPPSKEYLAVGAYGATIEDRQLPVRFACVYRTRVALPAHDTVDAGFLRSETIYRWRSVPIPGSPGRGRPETGAHRPALVCDRCFMQLPVAGVCDQCD